MLVFLKDIELSEIQRVLDTLFENKKVSRIIKDSDFINSRRSLLGELKKVESEEVVLAVYDIGYLKWSFIYMLFTFLSAKKKAYMVDKKANFKRLTLLYIFRISALSLCAIIKQAWDALTYSTKLPVIIKTKKKAFSGFEFGNIAYIRTTDTFNLKAGGSLGHTVGIINGFKSQGSKVHLFSIDKIEQVEVDNETIIEPSVFNNLINIFNRYNYNSRFFKRSKSIFSNNKFDFIYQRASRDNFSGVRASTEFETPLVLEFNSFLSWELAGATHPIHRLFIKPTVEIESLNLDRADLIVTVSEVLKEQLIDYGVSTQKILVCPNAVDPSKFYHDNDSAIELKKKLRIPKEAHVAGFSGTFGFWHGIDILVSSIEQFVKKNTNRFFVLIGDGPYRKSAEEKLKKYPNVIFTGIVPYSVINSYLSVCDILLSPHNIPKGEKFIGSPTKLFEYMSCGKVIIASNLDQLGEVISPSITVISSDKGYGISEQLGGEVGITVSPGSVEELSYAMDFAFEHIDALSYLGRNARDSACKKHSWNSVTASITDKLASILIENKSY